MSMNIKNELASRFKRIFRMNSVPPQLVLRGSVQPTVNYHEVMKKHGIIVIAATAGNVVTQIEPTQGYKLIFKYGWFTITNDATVADRIIRTWIEDAAGNHLSQGINNATAITASQTKTRSMRFGPGYFGDLSDLGMPGANDAQSIWSEEEIYETDFYEIEIVNGQAGDSYAFRLKYIESEIPREA